MTASRAASPDSDGRMDQQTAQNAASRRQKPPEICKAVVHRRVGKTTRIHQSHIGGRNSPSNHRAWVRLNGAAGVHAVYLHSNAEHTW